METLVLKSIKLNKKVTTILDPLEFEMEMKCNEEIPEGVVFTVVYNVNVKTDKDDQILSEIEIAPIPKGNVKFSLDTDAPDLSKIPYDQLFGLTSIIIIGKYKDHQFIRIGYIVDIYYPGIPNDKLANNELEDDVDYEEIAEEEEEEEEEEEGDNEDIDDLVVSDSEGEQEQPRTLTEAIEDKIHTVEKSKDENAVAEEEEEEVTEESVSHIREELDKPVGAAYEEKEDDNECFEYKGFKLSRSKIEMNIMEPPSVHTFLINWLSENEEGEGEGFEDVDEGEEDVEEGSKDEEVCEENVKKVKLE